MSDFVSEHESACTTHLLSSDPQSVLRELERLVERYRRGSSHLPFPSRRRIYRRALRAEIEYGAYILRTHGLLAEAEYILRTMDE